jgi:uncharacterized protein
MGEISGYVDAVVVPFTPELMWGVSGRDGLASSAPGLLEPYPEGFTEEQYLKRFDEAGVEMGLMIAMKAPGWTWPGGQGFPSQVSFWVVPYEGVRKLMEKYPGRFGGLAGIDPTKGPQGLQDLERAVTELGFVGAHLYPHWWKKAPNDRIYYPYYEKCMELDIPIQIQVGFAFQPFLQSVGRPLCLEDIAIDFPQLKIVGIHTGWPWVDEMIMVMSKFDNIYCTTSCHYPVSHYVNPWNGLLPTSAWEQNFIRFINEGPGKDKILLGTDFPIWDVKLTVDEMDQVLTKEAKEKVCRDNAVKLYKL